MAIRDDIAKLMAMAQQEEDPEVLARIASRLRDALNDRVEYLRALKGEGKASTESRLRGKKAG